MSTQTKSSNTKPSTADEIEGMGERVSDDVATLTARVEALAGDLARLGRSSLREASGGVHALQRRGQSLAGDIGRELTTAEQRAVGVVRESPLQSLGLAFGAGILLALFFRR